MSAAEPLVTVLTTVRNGERHLADTLESIRVQTLEDWEHVVVDDASDDSSVAIVSEFAQRDPRFRSVRRDVSGGPYVAANAGLAVARGRYVARIDADDLAVPHRLATQLAFLEARGSLRACGSSWQVISDDGRLRDEVHRFPVDAPAAMKWAVCVVSGLVHSTLFAEREALDACGGYAELTAAADYGLWCALARRGVLGMVGEPLLRWREHQGQMSASKLDLQRELSIEQLKAHVEALGGEAWTLDDVGALWNVGRWWTTTLPAGFASIRRWEALWRRDRTLSARDRATLFLLTNRLRVRHAKWNREGRTLAAVASLVKDIRLPIGR